MDDPGFFQKTRVLIVGLGLMGGSLALALHGKVAWIGGVDISDQVIGHAAGLNIFNALSTNLVDLLPSADLVVLAAPVRQNIKIIELLARYPHGRQMVLDLSSTKRQVMESLATLPPSYQPIGGHPMCGSEKSSILYSRSDLFSNAVFIICAMPRTSELTKTIVVTLAEQIGAHPLSFDPQTHDRIAAEISHFPYLLSAALSLSTSMQSKSLISTGFKSTARLAGSSPAMMLDILASNPDNILQAIASFKSVLQDFENALQARDENRLAGLIHQANSKYNDLISSK